MIHRCRPRVSLCMIVRNEAHNLPGCLGPVRDLVDEIVVVDTGSTDATREVALGLGARVIDFPWSDDFSAARNESLRHATGEFILWLDADDRLDAENAGRLETLLDSLSDARCAYVFRTVCETPSETGIANIVTHPRLFRAHDELHWQYRVHEQIMPCLERLNYEIVWSEVNVLHSGYADREMIHKKASRNLRLCRLDYAVSPHDPGILFHMGKEYARLGQNTEALLYLNKSLQAVTRYGTWVARLYGDMVSILVTLGRPADALATVSEALVRFPNSHELLFRQADLLQRYGNSAAAEQSLRQLLQAPQQNRFGDALSVAELRRQAFRLVGAACLGRRDFEQAEYFFQQWISETPADAEAWCMLGYAYVQRGFVQKAEFAIRQLRKLPGGEVFACCVLAEECKRHNDWRTARQQLERAVGVAPQLLMARAMLVDLLMASGADVEDCRQAVMEFLRLAPHNATAQQILDRINATHTPAYSGRVTVASNYPLAI